jgi:uncharacterized membrane protein HdeD (DUF308 family)
MRMWREIINSLICMNGTEFTEDSKQRGAWSTLGAIALMVAGVLAICMPLVTSIALVIILSWLLIFAGIAHLVEALSFKSVGNFAWELILAALCIYVGFYMRLHPAMGVATLVFMLAVFFLVSACSEFALYFRNRSLPNSGWILMHAILDVILFALIWVHWPANSTWLIGMFVGIDLLVAGLSRIVSGAPFFHHQMRGLSA